MISKTFTDDFITAAAVWNSSLPKSDEDLALLKSGFTFLSKVLKADSHILASHYARELERVKVMIEARKEK